MQISDEGSRLRALARYKFLFRASVAMLGAGLVATTLGVLAILFASSTTMFGTGLLLAIISVLNCYKIVTSTVRIIEVQAQEKGWNSLA